MRCVIGAGQHSGRGWVAALLAFHTPGPRLLLELGGSGSSWRMRNNGGLFHSQTVELIYDRLAGLRQQSALERRFKLEWITTAIGDLWSGATYRTIDELCAPDQLPAILAPASRRDAGYKFIDHSKELKYVFSTLEQGGGHHGVSVTVDLGWINPGLVAQENWLHSATEIVIVLDGSPLSTSMLDYFIDAFASTQLYVVVTGEKSGPRRDAAMVVGTIMEKRSMCSVVNLDWINNPSSLAKIPADALRLQKRPSQGALTLVDIAQQHKAEAPQAVAPLASVAP